MRIAVLGAGAWGTALAISFAHRHSVSLWARDPEKAARMQAAGENSRYLPGHRFPASLAGDCRLLPATEAPIWF
jgi:glycerol-3-phosphate dehydrogenase (NAD(P)+)